MDKEEVVAYLAGMFEGEGSVMIQRTSPRGKSKSPSYRLVVSMTNTNREVLEFAHEHYGGLLRGPYVRDVKWRPSYRWELWDSDSLTFLEDIAPHIQTKSEQIRLAFEFREQVENSRTQSLGKGYGSRPMAKDEVEARETIHQHMKNINKRGRH